MEQVCSKFLIIEFLVGSQGHVHKEIELPDIAATMCCAHVDQTCFSKASSVVSTESVLGALPLELPKLSDASQETCCKEETFRLEDPIEKGVIKQLKEELSVEPEIVEAETRKDKKVRLPVDAISPYLTIEPSLASDWLEISWDELHIKERVGAGTSFYFHEFLVYKSISDRCSTIMTCEIFLTFFQDHLELFIVLSGMDQ